MKTHSSLSLLSRSVLFPSFCLTLLPSITITHAHKHTHAACVDLSSTTPTQAHHGLLLDADMLQLMRAFYKADDRTRNDMLWASHGEALAEMFVYVLSKCPKVSCLFVYFVCVCCWNECRERE